MTPQPDAIATTRTDNSFPHSFIRRHHIWCALLLFIILEAVVFAPLVTKVGFYLDDWLMLSGLYFTKGAGLTKLWNYLPNDPKIVIRPVELLQFGTLFLLAGTKPLLWHIFNGVLEIISALLLYLCLFRLSSHRLLSIISAAFFVLCPIHDCTHYWILASSGTLSMVCWLGSLLAVIEGAQKRQVFWLLVSCFLFGISLFNYELLLPLCFVNVVVCVWLMSQRRDRASTAGASKNSVIRKNVPVAAAIWGSALTAAYLACIAFYWVWTRVLVPRFAHGYIHSVHVSASTMLNTILAGTAICTPMRELPFFVQQVRNAVDASAIAPSLLLGAVSFAIIWLFGDDKRDSDAIGTGVPDVGNGTAQPDNNDPPTAVAAGWQIALVAGVLIPISYTIFGLSPEYLPTLQTILNRINHGASVGVCVLYGLVVLAAAKLLAGRSPKISRLFIAGTTSAILVAFALTDLALAKPWELSWTMQRHVADLLKQHKDLCASASSIMLLNSPRYVMWAPVFDGTWDFENLARVSLNKGDANANVVSERLEVHPDQAVDVSSEFICGAYPFHGMVAIVAPQSLVLPVDSAEQFIDCVHQYGFGFGLDRRLPERWHHQLVAASRNSQRTQ